MLFIVGLVIVFGSVVGGYLAGGGHLAVLFQPFELVIILGAALGSFVIANPLPVVTGTLKSFGPLLKGSSLKKESYVELLSMLFAVFKLAKIKGDLALESHVDNPEESTLFSAYPGFMNNHHALEFLCDNLRIFTLGGGSPHELEAIMDVELEAMHAQQHAITAAVTTVSDALPALGIVAAVLGVIHTMGSIAEPPEVLGHLIGAALVGTFSGVLFAYGLVAPVAKSLESTFAAEATYLICIKAGLIAHRQGYAPQVSVEFARKTLQGSLKPNFQELDAALQAVQLRRGTVMAQKELRPIIVKRARKGGHGHHGGAWKVAYADFVTAMMAFFMLMWLLNAATKEQLRGISDYFAPISSKSTTSGGGGLLAGRTLAKNGVFHDETPRSPEDPNVAEPSHDGATGGDEDSPLQNMSDAELDAFLRNREEQQFRQAERQIREAIAATPDLSGLAKSLIIDDTPEGLRIQIIDQEGLPMFPRGEHDMYAHTRQVLELVARVVEKLPQDIAISGHTDATRYQGGAEYSNWELSADRANAARRTLAQFGVPESRIARVMGKAANEPLIKDDPEAPGNRRLSVVLLRGTGTGRK